ncbi:MAG: hypothetical protein LQ352_004064 [Teloschistes flavicans]|nr:MAG: hypothetical protein LQ352_004064 [Teloschistes flavicans]
MEAQNTSDGLASIELLRGPSTNVVPIACIAENIPNDGQFVYTFPTSLTPDTSHYGLRIIDSKAHTFQYSTQFGVRDDVVHETLTSATASVSQASDGQVQASTGSQTSSHQTATGSVLVTSAVANATTTSLTLESTSSVKSSIVIVATTHIPIPAPQSGSSYHLTVLQPSKNMTVPASLKTTQTQATTKVTASASASFSSTSGTGSPIVPGPTGSAPTSGSGKLVAGSLLAGLGATFAFIL